VNAEITPEAHGGERDAILRAVEAQFARDPHPAAYRSHWREQGIRENAGDDIPEEPG
jgi:hypothetical protein